MINTEQIDVQDVVYALSTSPGFAQDGVCFAARASGLYRSEDGGLTWMDAYHSLELRQALPTAAVAVSPAFLQDRAVFAGVPGGILRSSDGGHTWSVVKLQPPPPFVLDLALSPDFARDGVALAATAEDGVFRSGDRGRSWAAWNFGLLDLNILSLVLSPAFGQDETAFAGTESGIFRSTNGGRAWRETGFPAELAPVVSLAISPSFRHDGLLWAGTESSGIYCSRDVGLTWTRWGIGVGGAVNRILVTTGDPATFELMVLAGDGLLVSHSGGNAWDEWRPDMPPGCTLTVAAAPLGLAGEAPLLLGCADGSVHRVSWPRKGGATCA